MIIFSLLFLFIGLALLVGGVWLIALGGSWYYAITGLVLLVVGALTKNRRTSARLLYAAFLVATAVWALWESGYDWWPLATRMGLFLILAIPLLLATKSNKGGVKVLLPVWAVLVVGTLASTLVDKHKIDGELSTEIKVAAPNLGDAPADGWQAYGRSNMGQRYSPLDQITPANVSNLELAWQYQTGDKKGPGDVGETTYEATPLKLGNTLYLCTPHNWLVALDADSGKKVWQYKAAIEPDLQRQHQTCRGVSYLPGTSGQLPVAKVMDAPSESLAPIACDAELFLPTSDAKLIALDPATGARCQNFADEGVLDLTQHMPFKQHGYYYSTSPPLVAKGKVIVAGSVNDNYAVNSPSGVIRAFDARTGQLLWNFDSGNPDQTAPLGAGEVYTPSSPNSWSVASADEKLDLAYFPMGNRTPDQLGMYRSPAEEKYASSVLALNLDTGKPAWVQQFIHHDLWDMDTPAQPVLLDLQTKNGLEPALVVPTKQGDVYVLNRATGQPIFPITEEPAPQGTDIPGDHTSPTQPSSALNFKPPTLKESDMWGASPLDQLWCRIEFKTLNYQGQYTAPSTKGTIVFPGNFGVFNWGSVAVDPKRQVMFGMPLYLAFTSTLVKKDGGDLGPANQGEHGLNANEGGPYAVDMKPFLSPLGVPCQQPPWGYVAGVDLSTGKKVWQHKNGTIHDMTPLPLPIKMGVPGIGGPVITAGGVVFMSAAVDDYIRAYDLTSGKVLWQARLPAGGQATPMTYVNSKGEQMVVQVAGGHGSIGTTIGDYVVAYKLKH
ncbi:glucose/quinate/shikimate family membrane-bound PQQ-dependent dehydrogenase [Gallaecimonas pentaromativorans]|uniref:Quinoprotein glucose dehydrogenase n=1 Tax=Gallaecimonas pentaromativorans TaxID=584787 RepID=A0A3N1PSB7_9GAMM|nr:glucose/quinate/shikimate family membrane-bound PQQ-dependent dehydrogenase [Gallaecimonas pentaromativorans]ROQ30011.1 quinoprotein glucose dehydrogenase [Gallaecimonas pentaromativorans]